MRRKISKSFLIFLLSILSCFILVLTGCSNSKQAIQNDSISEGEFIAQTEPISNFDIAEGEGSNVTANTEKAANTAKLIYTASATIQTTQFNKTIAEIEAKIANIPNAYFEEKNIQSHSHSLKYANITVRVPAQETSSVLDNFTTGTIVSKTENTKDVSEDYYDTETRLNTEKIKLERLQNLLASATDLNDIITLEDTISETEYKIDTLTGTLRHYDSQIDFASISMSVEEVAAIDNAEVPTTFSKKSSSAFQKGIQGFVDAMQSVALFFVQTWIWWVIFLIIPGIIGLCIWKKYKNRAKQNTSTQSSHIAE